MSVGDEEDFETGSLGESESLCHEDFEEDEEDDEENPEPKLNFIRIRNDLVSILEKDAVSCVAVHSKVIFIFGLLRLFFYVGIK